MNVSKNHVKYNVLMALAILFAICYQSLHVFTNEAHKHHVNDEIAHKTTFKCYLEKKLTSVVSTSGAAAMS